MRKRTARPLRVFISYSHDSDEHRSRVLGLADRLVRDGIDARVDQYVENSPPKSWPRWMMDEVEEADHVLVVCTEIYNKRFRDREEPGKGKGARWEGAVITQELYEDDSKGVKFVPVIFSTEDRRHIPTPLRGTTHHTLTSAKGYEGLYRQITHQPLTPKPDLGRSLLLPPDPRRPLLFQDEEPFSQFESRYRKQARIFHQWLSLPHQRKSKRGEIDAMYVPQGIGSQGDGASARVLSLQEFCSEAYRAVVLANPGEGKSALLQKICYDLGALEQAQRFRQLNPLPVLLLVREYAAARRGRGCSIVAFMKDKSEANLQLSCPQEAFEYLLERGRLAVLFDGLDEVVELSQRREVADAIEVFCRLYQNVSVVVTSRIQGYDLAPLDDTFFQAFTLSSFGPEEIQKYVANWLRREKGLSGPQLRKQVSDFLRESAGTRNLRTNPLMLGLMCALFSEGRSIPENLTELIRQSSELFFSRQDKARGIAPPLPPDIGRAITGAIAFWVYSDEDRQTAVPEDALVRFATEFVSERFGYELVGAEDVAREFVAHCADRCGLLTKVGEDDRGVPLYQFTYRVFLEYFAGADVLTRHPDAQTLTDFLLPKVAEFKWCEVGEFAIQILDRRRCGDGDTVVHSLLAAASASSDAESRLRVMIFAILSLRYVAVSHSTARSICSAYVDWAIDWVIDRTPPDQLLGPAGLMSGGRARSTPRDLLLILLRDLLVALEENQTRLAEGLQHSLRQKILDGTDAQALVAYEVAHCLPSFFRNGDTDAPKRETWSQIAAKAVEGCSDRIAALAPLFVTVCCDAVGKGLVSLTDLACWHGLDALFTCQRTFYDERAFVGGEEAFSHSATLRAMPAMLLLEGLLDLRPNEDTMRFLRSTSAQQLVDMFLCDSPPWVRRPDRAAMLLRNYYDKEVEHSAPQSQDLNLTGAGAFLAFVFYAAILEETETMRDGGDLFLVPMIKNSKLPLHHVLRWQLVARFADVDRSLVEDELARCGYTEKQHQAVVA